jgi:hypothetical protein
MSVDNRRRRRPQTIVDSGTVLRKILKQWDSAKPKRRRFLTEFIAASRNKSAAELEHEVSSSFAPASVIHKRVHLDTTRSINCRFIVSHAHTRILTHS